MSLNSSLRAQYVRDPPSNLNHNEINEWSKVLVDCIEKFNSLGKTDDIYQCLLVLKKYHPVSFVTQLESLGRLEQIEESLPYLKEETPFAACAALKTLGKDKERRSYCMDSLDLFTIYVIEYFEPMLEELRAAGKL